MSRELQQVQQHFQRVHEQVDILFGIRGRPEDAAVRLRAFKAMLEIVPARPSSTPASAAPTMAEYNALQQDVATLFEAIGSLRLALSGR